MATYDEIANRVIRECDIGTVTECRLWPCQKANQCQAQQMEATGDEIARREMIRVEMKVTPMGNYYAFSPDEPGLHCYARTREQLEDQVKLALSELGAAADQK